LLLNLWKNFSGRNYGLSTDYGTVAAEADVSVTYHLMNRVIGGVLAHSFAVVYELAHVNAIKADFGSLLQHVSEILERL